MIEILSIQFSITAISAYKLGSVVARLSQVPPRLRNRAPKKRLPLLLSEGKDYATINVKQKSRGDKAMEVNREGSSPLSLASPQILCSREATFQKGVMELLQLVQSDYSKAKKQLEEVYEVFSHRETTVNKQIQTVLGTGGIGTALNEARNTVQGVDDVVVNRPGSDVPSQTLVSQPAISLRIYCLGRFEVYSGQKKVDQWRSLKAKSLLKFLVTQRGRHVPKDVLMEALWPGYPPEAASNNLKAAVYALRQTISSSWLEAGCNNKNGFSPLLFSEGRYTLNPEMELQVDVEEFQQRWTTGRRLEKEGKYAEAISEYQMAERSYRGDYLEDDLYEDWTLLQREALKDTYLTILAKLAEDSFEEADLQGCIAYCQKILAKDSCREDAYRQLMRCHSRLGQRHRALRWHELCARTMKRELGVAPENQTTDLYQRLLRQEYI
jgi:DNA-binding SARP family transcriptional activator